MNDDRDEWVRHGRAFGSVAGAYAELRPGYPPEVAHFLLGERGRQVLDLGAGTGKLSEILLADDHDLIAVEPAVEMLAELVGRYPDVHAVVGRAEAIPLSDDSVDAVVAGQAAHWFDLPSAAPEIARVLRPGGVVGLVWNLRDERVGWVAALGQLLAAEDNHVVTEEEGIAGALSEQLGYRLERIEYQYSQVLTPDEVVAGLATRSYVVLLEPTKRCRLLSAARQLLATHPDTAGLDVIEHPYRTFAYKLSG